MATEGIKSVSPAEGVEAVASEQKPMARIASRVINALDPDSERARLNAVPLSDFVRAFEEDPVGSLRFYPFGCAQAKGGTIDSGETDLEYNIMEFYRETALKSEALAKVALEVFAQHPTNPNSPRPNPYTQGLMWNVMLKYPKLFLDQISELTGQSPEALHKFIMTYAEQVKQQAPVARGDIPVPQVTANTLTRSNQYSPGIGDSVSL